MTERSVLSPKLAGGPHGLGTFILFINRNIEIFILIMIIQFAGDPNDRYLRKVEKEVMIPKLMREKARSEKCVPEVGEFVKCCKDASLAMVYKCRTENTNLKACLTRWYQDESFRQLCTEEYLKERSEYRRTGIGKKQKELEKQLYTQTA